MYEILMVSQDYTLDAHPVCGSTCCRAGLYALGVSSWEVENEEVPETIVLSVDSHLETVRKGEWNECVHCVICGDFMSHGLECACPTDEFGDVVDPESLGGPGIDFRTNGRLSKWNRINRK